MIVQFTVVVRLMKLTFENSKIKRLKLVGSPVQIGGSYIEPPSPLSPQGSLVSNLSKNLLRNLGTTSRGKLKKLLEPGPLEFLMKKRIVLSKTFQNFRPLVVPKFS